MHRPADRRPPACLTFTRRALARGAAAGAAALLLAACGRGEATPAADARASGASSAAPPAAARADAPPPDLCRLLPAADVARVLGASAGLSVSTARPETGGGCTYHSAPQDTLEVRLLVDAARHATAAEAGRALDAARTMHRERNLPVADAPELGEGGFVSREGGRAGAKYQVGPYSGQVNLSAGEAAASDREARAASAVAAELRRRLGPDAAGP